MADGKTKEERRAELQQKLLTKAGTQELVEMLMKHMGLPPGSGPPVGTLLIEEILGYEYPPKDAPAKE